MGSNLGRAGLGSILGWALSLAQILTGLGLIVNGIHLTKHVALRLLIYQFQIGHYLFNGKPFHDLLLLSGSACNINFFSFSPEITLLLI